MLPFAAIVTSFAAGAVKPSYVFVAGVTLLSDVPVRFSTIAASQFVVVRLPAAVQSPSFCL